MLTTIMTAVIAIMLITIVALTVMVVSQKRELDELKKPKFGFLGKSLYSLVIGVALVGITSNFVSLDDNVPRDTDVSNNIEYVVNIEKFIGEQDIDGKYSVELRAIPIDEARPYGLSPYKIYWKIYNNEGNLEKEYFESNITFDSPGGVDLKLYPGNYNLELIIEREGEQFKIERTIVI